MAVAAEEPYFEELVHMLEQIRSKSDQEELVFFLGFTHEISQSRSVLGIQGCIWLVQ